MRVMVVTGMTEMKMMVNTLMMLKALMIVMFMMIVMTASFNDNDYGGHSDDGNGCDEDDDMIDNKFVAHVHCNLLHIDEMDHILIPCFTFISPTISTSFRLHVML